MVLDPDIDSASIPEQTKAALREAVTVTDDDIPVTRESLQAALGILQRLPAPPEKITHSWGFIHLEWAPLTVKCVANECFVVTYPLGTTQFTTNELVDCLPTIRRVCAR